MLLSRRKLLGILSTAAIPGVPAALAGMVSSRHEAHDAEYHLHFNYTPDDLIGDLLHGERGEAERESETPHRHWYSEEIRHRMGAWGPRARIYAPLAEARDRPIEWKRERVIATAARFIGYEYQHHHIPDWNPPANWPWKECCAGHNGKGVDCSNFTSFVYNQGFGIKFTSDVVAQSKGRTAVEGGEERIGIQSIELPEGYQQRQEMLRTGDLVFIRGKIDGPITHVVLWVGSIGRAESGVPLILDSHGGDVQDDHGKPISCGIHLRPFREKSWYNRCASHAHRLF